MAQNKTRELLAQVQARSGEVYVSKAEMDALSKEERDLLVWYEKEYPQPAGHLKFARRPDGGLFTIKDLIAEAACTKLVHDGGNE